MEEDGEDDEDVAGFGSNPSIEVPNFLRSSQEVECNTKVTSEPDKWAQVWLLDIPLFM